MDLSIYGPFANVVALTCAIVATFSVLLLRMLGDTKRWTWLAGGSPPFMVTAGARMLAVALMAVIYVTIDSSNYVWFGIVAVLFGGFSFLLVARFDRLRKQYVMEIPLVGLQGEQLVDEKGNPMYESVVVGLEADLLPNVKADLEKARQEHGALSLRQFMSGYGAHKLYDPEALWDRVLLAELSNKLTMTLMYIVLCAVMAVFLAAFMIEVYSRAA